jgi:hypothetical protein
MANAKLREELVQTKANLDATIKRSEERDIACFNLIKQNVMNPLEEITGVKIPATKFSEIPKTKIEFIKAFSSIKSKLEALEKTPMADEMLRKAVAKMKAERDQYKEMILTFEPQKEKLIKVGRQLLSEKEHLEEGMKIYKKEVDRLNAHLKDIDEEDIYGSYISFKAELVKTSDLNKELIIKIAKRERLIAAQKNNYSTLARKYFAEKDKLKMLAGILVGQNNNVARKEKAISFLIHVIKRLVDLNRSFKLKAMSEVKEEREDHDEDDRVPEFFFEETPKDSFNYSPNSTSNLNQSSCNPSVSLNPREPDLLFDPSIKPTGPQVSNLLSKEMTDLVVRLVNENIQGNSMLQHIASQVREINTNMITTRTGIASDLTEIKSAFIDTVGEKIEDLAKRVSALGDETNKSLESIELKFEDKICGNENLIVTHITKSFEGLSDHITRNAKNFEGLSTQITNIEENLILVDESVKINDDTLKDELIILDRKLKDVQTTANGSINQTVIINKKVDEWINKQNSCQYINKQTLEECVGQIKQNLELKLEHQGQDVENCLSTYRNQFEKASLEIRQIVEQKQQDQSQREKTVSTKISSLESEINAKNNEVKEQILSLEERCSYKLTFNDDKKLTHLKYKAQGLSDMLAKQVNNAEKIIDGATINLSKDISKLNTDIEYVKLLASNVKNNVGSLIAADNIQERLRGDVGRKAVKLNYEDEVWRKEFLNTGLDYKFYKERGHISPFESRHVNSFFTDKEMSLQKNWNWRMAIRKSMRNSDK